MVDSKHNVGKFNQIFQKLRKSGQNVQYFSQMARLFVAFPEYLGHSNQFVTSLWGFSENSGNSTQNTYRFVVIMETNTPHLLCMWHC